MQLPDVIEEFPLELRAPHIPPLVIKDIMRAARSIELFSVDEEL